jgi:hypothetical protein
VITDAELRQALNPVFEEMLSERELSSLRLSFTRLFIDGTERPLSGGERLEDGDVRVHWEILGEEGWVGSPTHRQVGAECLQ